MAKKIYHIPLEKTRTFIKLHKEELASLYANTARIEYAARLGGARYALRIEAFVSFFGLDRNGETALETFERFSTEAFLSQAGEMLNLSQFATGNNPSLRFYGLCYTLWQYDEALFEQLLEKLFIHFHPQCAPASDIRIDYKEIAQTLAALKHLRIKESFGKDDEGAYFKLFVQDLLHVLERGSSIKTLRKKAYKKLCTILLDNDLSTDPTAQELERLYERLEALKS